MKRGICTYSSFFLLLLASCRNYNTVEMGASKYYRLDIQEKVFPLTQTAIDNFEALIRSISIELPLNRYIKSSQYELFVGVAMNDDIKTLIQKIQSDTTFHIIHTKLVQNSSNYFISKNNLYLIGTVVEDKYPLILLAKSNDSIGLRKKYDEDYFYKKLSN